MTHSDRYAHDCTDVAAVTRWRCPWVHVPRQSSVALCVFCGQKMEAKHIHKEILPMYGEHCLSRQAVYNWVQKFSEGWTSIEDEHRAGRTVEIATPVTFSASKTSSEQRGGSPFPETCETVGQVFKFVWRLCWKIDVVCMPLSPFYSFQSWFVTYLLNCPRSIGLDVWFQANMTDMKNDSVLTRCEVWMVTLGSTDIEMHICSACIAFLLWLHIHKLSLEEQ